MAENKNYDVVILGGGPGGYVAAIRAGQLGLKTAVIEKEAVGGVCLHHGCIPSKTIIRSAEVLSLIQRSETFGIKVDNVRPDFGFAIDRSQKVIQRLYNGVQHLMKNKVDIHLGTGRLVAPNRIEVTHSTGKTTLQGERVLIATGSRVRSLPNIRIDGKGIFTSDEALLLRDLPRSIAIIGGGAVGVEFAYVYAIYGVDVTIIEMTPALLPTEDHEVSALLERSFKKRGVSVLTGVRV
ncbi:MAG: FAD-dependent oxidoreductase, partial [Nitrospiria bacterium]